MTHPDHDGRPGQPQVRDARPDDAPAIGSLLAELGWFGAAEGELQQRASQLIPDAHELSRAMLVAELAGEVAGYLHVTWVHPVFQAGPEAYITELFVSEAARGRGVGSALLGAAQRQAAELGAVRVRLLGGRDREHYERGFYPSRGYDRRDDLAVFEREVAP